MPVVSVPRPCRLANCLYDTFCPVRIWEQVNAVIGNRSGHESDSPYADLAHQARIKVIGELQKAGCTCHPYMAVALLENIDDELVAHVQINGHEVRCRLDNLPREG